MRILCTGGGGYLGSVLVPMLLEVGHVVTVVDTFTHGVPSLIAHMNNPALHILREDARSSITLRLVQEHDMLIPLAAVVGAPACDRDPLTAETLNREAVKDLVTNASSSKIIIYPCTNSGYGIGGETECTEDSPLTPISLYGRTKIEAEEAVLAHPGGITLRLATLFGCSPRMRLDLMVNDFVYRAIHDRALILFEQHFRRNFLHVRDASAAFMFAMLHYDRMVGHAYNVGDSRANMTKMQLAERIRKQVPFSLTEGLVGADPDKRNYVVSNARIEAFGWRPQFTLDDGIAELVRAYRGMPFERIPWRNI